MSTSRLDLNLLVALDALLQERSVTRAAERLGLTQPTLSTSLARLRRHFDDDLLRRVGNRSELTPLGLSLRPMLATALGSIERVVSASGSVDPATSTRRFTLVASDYGTSVVGAELGKLLALHAPGMSVHLRQANPVLLEPVDEKLREVDGLLMPHGFPPPDLPHVDLFTDRWVFLVAADHPAVPVGLTWKDLRGRPWVITFSESGGAVGGLRHLHLLGVQPRAQAVVDSFLAVPHFLLGTDRIALLPERVARLLAGTGDAGVTVLECPFDAVPLVEALWWHPVFEHDAEHRWLRSRLAARFVETAPTRR